MVYRISQLGYRAMCVVQELGKFAAFAMAIGVALFTPRPRVGAFVRELYKLGVLSLVIICLCGCAVGMVLGLQGYHLLVRFGLQSSLGSMVGLSLIRELGPVLTALLVIGRAGSATTAEIGTMIATEQLDGLRMQSIDPIHLVVTPKMLAPVHRDALANGIVYCLRHLRRLHCGRGPHGRRPGQLYGQPAFLD